MLKTRIITAVVLLAVLLAVLFGGYYPAFAAAVLVFLTATIMETFQLFNSSRRLALVNALFWSASFAYTFLWRPNSAVQFWFALSAAIWLVRFVPALAHGLPPAVGLRNTLLSNVYGLAIVGAFAAIVTFYQHSPMYLLSVMALVWIADIGAYFAGKAFGKRKLAPSISPGKSWEGAIGGGICVLLASSAAMLFAREPLADTFVLKLYSSLGWLPGMAILAVLVAASIVGDLFESLLKRRAGVKDSSNLLPGHGGVLDRIDALVPVLPLAALIDAWL